MTFKELLANSKLELSFMFITIEKFKARLVAGYSMNFKVCLCSKTKWVQIAALLNSE